LGEQVHKKIMCHEVILPARAKRVPEMPLSGSSLQNQGSLLKEDRRDCLGIGIEEGAVAPLAHTDRQ
jgi:hypothetical protein